MKNILLNTAVVLMMVVAALAVYALAIRDSSGVIYKEAVVKEEFTPFDSDDEINYLFQHYQDFLNSSNKCNYSFEERNSY